MPQTDHDFIRFWLWKIYSFDNDISLTTVYIVQRAWKILYQNCCLHRKQSHYSHYVHTLSHLWSTVDTWISVHYKQLKITAKQTVTVNLSQLKSSKLFLPIEKLLYGTACKRQEQLFCNLHTIEDRPFLWPLTSFPDHHTYSVPSVQYCLCSCVEQFCWDLIRTCGFATCCLTAGTSNLWTKWCRLLLPIFLFNSFPFFIMYKFSQYPFHLSAICAALVKFSPIADIAGTFESLIWLSKRAAWNFLSSLLLSIPCICLPAAAVYPLSELSLYLSLQFVLWVLIFAFCFPFSLIAAKVSLDIHFFFLQPDTSNRFLATSSRTVLVPFHRSSGVTSSCATSNAIN